MLEKGRNEFEVQGEEETSRECSVWMSSMPLHQTLLMHKPGTLHLGNRQLGWSGSGLAAGNLAEVDHGHISNSSFGKGWHQAVPGLALMALALGSNWHITGDLMGTNLSKTVTNLTDVRKFPCETNFFSGETSELTFLKIYSDAYFILWTKKKLLRSPSKG